jgi:hypothetical protein
MLKNTIAPLIRSGRQPWDTGRMSLYVNQLSTVFAATMQSPRPAYGTVESRIQ